MIKQTKTAVFSSPAASLRPLTGALALGFMLLALPGCRIPSLCGADPGPELPDDYRGLSSTDDSAQIGIKEFFDDPVLTELVTYGLAQNQELKIRNQEIEIAANDILARRGAYLPFITGSFGGGFDKHSFYTPLGAAEDQLTYPGGGRFPDPVPNIGLFANLFWQVDIWREFRNARDAAIERYNAAIESRNYLITKLVAETAENYYELAALDKRLEFLNQIIELQEQSLEVAEAQKEAARGTELAVQRFLAEVRKNQSERLIVQQRIIEVENRINFLVGRYPQTVDRAAWDYIALDSRVLSVGVPADLLLNRRDIQAAEFEVAAAGLDVLVARARFFPRLDITAQIGYEAFDPQFLFEPEALVANAAGELVAPLINRRAIRAEYLSANARQLQAIYDYQRTVLNAFTEVVNNMAKVENYRSSVALKQDQVVALEESVSIASDLFQSARAEYVDVLFSQRDLVEARIALVETKQQQLAGIVNAYQALGGGFLLSTGGPEFDELFCPPAELAANLAPEDANSPPPPTETTTPIPDGYAVPQADDAPVDATPPPELN